MVAKFEQQTGIVLFDRKTKPISITPHGEIMIKHLKNINREFLLMDEGVKQIKGEETGHLRIACIPTVASFLFPLILNAVGKTYPRVTFNIREITTEMIVEELMTGNVDLGIVSTPLKLKEITEIPLYKEPFVLFDKREKRNASNNYKIRIDEIDYDKLILLEEGHCFRNQVLKVCNLRQTKKLKNNIIYTSGTLESLKKIVTINKGMTLLPSFSILDFNKKELKNVGYFLEPVPVREIGLIFHANNVKTKLTEGIEKIIKNKITTLEMETGLVNVVQPF